MSRFLVVLAVLGSVVGAVLVRRGVAVRAIRSLDRRGGLFTVHGARAYASGSGLLRGLHRHVVNDVAEILEDGLVVDVGSGPGNLIVELRTRLPGVRVLGVEPSPEMREIAAERAAETVDGRAEAMSFDNGSVDLVVSTLSSHHWEDPVAAFREIGRVLRPGGRARIYDVRFAGFGRDEAQQLAAKAGLDPANVERTILDERVFGLRPYAVTTIRT